MDQKYNGNAVEGLYASYIADKEPFIIELEKLFPDRESEGFPEITLLRCVLFPNYWNKGRITRNKELLADEIDNLCELFIRGLNAYNPQGNNLAIANKVIDSLPQIRELLKKDVEAAFNGDPAANDYTQIIRA